MTTTIAMSDIAITTVVSDERAVERGLPARRPSVQPPLFDSEEIPTAVRV